MGMDSHFNLDRTRNALGLVTKSRLGEIITVVPTGVGYSINLVGAVANFCDPRDVA